MQNGYSGKFLQVALTDGVWTDFSVKAERLKKFIGGSSLAASLYLERFNLDADPLSAENPLMLMNGPLVGSGFPGSSRFAMAAKSPQTGIWGEAACGGNFGPELKRAGYDGVIITGKSPHPVILSITNNSAEISSAANCWGKDIYETTDILKAPDKNIKV